MIVKIKTFDDISLIPKFSEIEDINSISIDPKIIEFPELKIPILLSSKDFILSELFHEIAIDNGLMSILNKHYLNFNYFILYKNAVMEIDDLDNVGALYDLGVRIFYINKFNVANNKDATFCNIINQKYPDAKLIIGNFMTGRSIKMFSDRIYNNNVLFWKIGIDKSKFNKDIKGTGLYVPTLQSLLDITQSYKYNNIIAEGEMRNFGDIIKALAIGAKLVIIPNSVFSNCFVRKNGYKVYINKNEYNRKKPEWELEEFIKNSINSIKLGLYYQGASSLEELRQESEFIFSEN